MFKSVKEISLLAPFIYSTFPQVKKNLKEYSGYLSQSTNPELKNQAMASLKFKQFHCLGGSVYGVGCNRILPFITSFQTISDYLDNLCDRAEIIDEEGFRLLHKSMIDSLSPTAFTPDYYMDYPLKGDGGYLVHLVENCQHCIETLPSYHKVRQYTLKLTELYRDLQVYKHLDSYTREEKLTDWAKSHENLAPELYWWEFAAATGSTLPIFALVRLASKKNLQTSDVLATFNGYFPYISGLHILLDYIIDQQEDKLGGDLNFINYYHSLEQTQQRLLMFVKKSLDKAGSLPNPSFHETIVKGLLAMYLSDPKVKENSLHELSLDLLNLAGTDAKLMYNICIKLRKKGTLK